MIDMIYRKMIERRSKFLTAWKEGAETAVFSMMSLEEFEAATQKSVSVRERIITAKAQLSLLNQERVQADEETGRVLKLVASGVRGDPQYGEESPLYRAMGYVPSNRRKSGLTRKVQDTTETNAA